VPTTNTEPGKDCEDLYPSKEPSPFFGGGGRQLEFVDDEEDDEDNVVDLQQEAKQAALRIEEQESFDSFDFVVAGFPKCGTTSLMHLFAAHNETDMATHEQCTVASPGMSDGVILRKMDEDLEALDPTQQRAFKCPTAMYNPHTISRMRMHSPAAKFIVGVRHPIRQLESFYNYRVTELYNNGLSEDIPSLREVWEGDEAWKGVSQASSRYEAFLMQFGKTDLSLDDMTYLAQHGGLAVRPSRFQIFLYTTEQLEDEDEERSDDFRQGLQNFLGLHFPLPSIEHANVNHQTGADGYAETIDICDAQFADIRAALLDQGEESASWIVDRFLDSSDVRVANMEHFVESLDSWSLDPCEDR